MNWLERHADPIVLIAVVLFALIAFFIGDGVR